MVDGPAVEILADAGYQGLGAQTGGRVVTPPHRKFKKNAPDWYEEMHERRRKAHSSRRIRVEHGIAHLKNWRALARHLGRREHMSDTIQAVAGLLSHQQTADLHPKRFGSIRDFIKARTAPGNFTMPDAPSAPQLCPLTAGGLTRQTRPASTGVSGPDGGA
uniref:Transposase n=1 Tax=Streptomyces drozdowiczii TaxID=202862 RepID=A0A0D4WUR6_9ACTN|nr:transposase [Streptomyces drozdowiczii]